MSYCLFICFCISEKLFNYNLTLEYRGRRAVVVWQLDLQLHMQSVAITTDVVSSNLDQGDVYNIM